MKFKWIKDQWRKYTDRIKKGSDKSPVEEPEWYKIINPIFSDTHGNLEIASKARDVLSHENSDTDRVLSVREREREIESTRSRRTQTLIT